MNNFILIPVILVDNDPDDEVDYDALGIEEPEAPQEVLDVLLNLSKIERINAASGGQDYETVIWVDGERPYHSTLPMDDIKKLIHYQSYGNT